MPIMRFAPILAGLVLSGLVLSGTAQAAAYPVRDPDLTKHELYRTGELKATKCAEPGLEPDDVPGAKRYVTAVLKCLDTAWAAHFKRAGMKFTKSRVGFITKPRRYCGSAWGSAAAAYCYKERRFVVLLDDDLLEDPSDLFLFELVAHEYGHHLQNITGMAEAYAWYPDSGKSELNEQSRRNELQATCLGGVFIGSVWNSLDRTQDDWDYLLDILRESGDEQYKVRDHGKGANIAAWLDKGFKAVSPAACNTWTASSSKVS
jgi:uncharacterized protein